MRAMSNEEIATWAIRKMQEEYSDDKLRLSSLADELYVSSAHLSRAIKRETRKSFTELLTDIRIQKAIELMSSSSSIKVCAVAAQVGYSSQHYFCRVFKECTGYTPSEYMRILHTQSQK